MSATISAQTLFDSSSARLSPCSQYRYDLQRRWAGGPLLTFVMLNPSTADATIDDPTIRRCKQFALREGCAGIRVVNLFAARASKPRDLTEFADPVGPDNDACITAAIVESGRIVCAWGAASAVPASLALALWWRVAFVLRVCSIAGRTPLCLGTTLSGQPRHPLYVRADQPLEVWR